MSAFTSLEANLARLDWIKNEMQTLYEEFPFIRDVVDPKIDYTKNRGINLMKTILGEFLTIRLHDFIEIRDNLLTDLREIGKEKLDECLKPFWQPIVLHKKSIIQMRNTYFAHMQRDSKKPFEWRGEEIAMLAGFPVGYGDARFYAGCVWHYSELLKLNLKEENERARKKYLAYKPVAIIPVRLQEKDVDAEMKRVKEGAISNLRDNGFII